MVCIRVRNYAADEETCMKVCRDLLHHLTSNILLMITRRRPQDRAVPIYDPSPARLAYLMVSRRETKPKLYVTVNNHNQNRSYGEQEVVISQMVSVLQPLGNRAHTGSDRD
jgi:hypothetical protein